MVFNRHLWTTISVGFMLMLQACSQNESNPEVIFFPLEKGNRWEYSYKLFLDNVVIDGVPLDSILILAQDIITLEAGASEEIDGVHAQTLIETSTTDSLPPGKFFYREQADGLYLYGITGVSTRSFMKSRLKDHESSLIVLNRQTVKFSGMEFVSGRQYQGVFSAFPRLSLRYPLEIGSQWTYLDSSEVSILSQKRVVAQTSISVPAGTFEVFKIKWLQDFDRDGIFDPTLEFYDYVSSDGLIRRSHTDLEDVPILNTSFQVIGSGNLTETLDLIDFSIK